MQGTRHWRINRKALRLRACLRLSETAPAPSSYRLMRCSYSPRAFGFLFTSDVRQAGPLRHDLAADRGDAKAWRRAEHRQLQHRGARSRAR
eukprot:2497541-Pleurochrysis_carterae.AAC.1